MQALTASEKKMIFNIKRRGEAYRRKDEALATYSEWLRFKEGPNGKWHCASCHAHPSLRHPQDKLANHRAPVLAFAYFKKHAESDCHRVAMQPWLLWLSKLPEMRFNKAVDVAQSAASGTQN